MKPYSMHPLKLLFVSTPVGPLGSGVGGGVELTLRNIAQEMVQRGHSLRVLAPVKSKLSDISLIHIPGEIQEPAQIQDRTAPVCLPGNSVLANMWNHAYHNQAHYDLIVNFAYDWLPFYITPFFSKPIAHFISMGSLTNAMDQIADLIADSFPGTIGRYTQAQAKTFAFAEKSCCLGSAVDLSLYEFCAEPDSYLVFLGRIAPEKGLEDAVAIAQTTNTPLKILGKMENKEYWQQICRDYPHAPIEYLGFFPTDQMQKVLRKGKALLMTHRWVEAFGNVAIESLACGVPVIAYQRGGPSEIVRHGQTGWLVEPDNVTEMCNAVSSIHQIDRFKCRQQAESEYSLTALGDRFEQWFKDILGSRNQESTKSSIGSS